MFKYYSQDNVIRNSESIKKHVNRISRVYNYNSTNANRSFVYILQPTKCQNTSLVVSVMSCCHVKYYNYENCVKFFVFCVEMK